MGLKDKVDEEEFNRIIEEKFFQENERELERICREYGIKYVGPNDRGPSDHCDPTLTVEECDPYTPVQHLAGLILYASVIRGDSDELHIELQKKKLRIYRIKGNERTELCSPPEHLAMDIMETIRKICGFDKERRKQHTTIGKVDAYYTPIPYGERVVLK